MYIYNNIEINKLFSVYAGYKFHNKTQIKNDKLYIYFTQLRHHQDDTDLCSIVKRIPSISREKFTHNVSPSTIIYVNQIYTDQYCVK